MTTTIRTRVTLGLNLASLLLGLVGAALAAWPTINPFHGKELMDVTVDMTFIPKTPEFERWQATNDSFGRLGLLLVALGTAAAAAAQIIERHGRQS